MKLKQKESLNDENRRIQSIKLKGEGHNIFQGHKFYKP